MTDNEPGPPEGMLLETWTPGDILYFGPNSRCLAIYGQVCTETIYPLISQLLELELRESCIPIRLYINTEGCSLSDALAAYDILRSVDSPIITIANGLCASAGLILLSAGDLKIATEETIFFYHQAIMPEAGSFVSKDQISETMNGYNISQEKFDKIILENSKIKKAVWRKEFEGKTAKYFNVQQAVDFGLIAGTIPNKKKKKVRLPEV